MFTPDTCDDCKHMAEGWEAEFDYNKMMAPYMNNYKNSETCDWKFIDYKIYYQPNKRLMKDPAKEKLYKRRKRENRQRWDKEHPCVRRKVQRKFKTKMKNNICNEAYYNIRPRDYRTYGWETW